MEPQIERLCPILVFNHVQGTVIHFEPANKHFKQKCVYQKSEAFPFSPPCVSMRVYLFYFWHQSPDLNYVKKYCVNRT